MYFSTIMIRIDHLQIMAHLKKGNYASNGILADCIYNLNFFVISSKVVLLSMLDVYFLK